MYSPPLPREGQLRKKAPTDMTNKAVKLKKKNVKVKVKAKAPKAIKAIKHSKR